MYGATLQSCWKTMILADGVQPVSRDIIISSKETTKCFSYVSCTKNSWVKFGCVFSFALLVALIQPSVLRMNGPKCCFCFCGAWVQGLSTYSPENDIEVDIEHN